jgi:hypothetical protein
MSHSDAIVKTSLRIPVRDWAAVIALGQRAHRSAHAQVLAYISEGLARDLAELPPAAETDHLSAALAALLGSAGRGRAS